MMNQLKKDLEEFDYYRDDMDRVPDYIRYWGRIDTVIMILFSAGFLSFIPKDYSVLQYIGGLIFFLLSFYAGLFSKVSGIFVLLIHGAIGLGLMELTLMKDILDTPQFTDMNHSFYFIIAFILILFIAAVVLTIVHNLSEKVKRLKWFKIIPLVLFFIGVFMTVILQKML